MNKLFQQLQNQSQNPVTRPPQSQGSYPSLKNNLNFISNILNQGSDPSVLIQSLISKNPQLKSIMDSFQLSGMTPKQFFYNYAQSQGVNPIQFLSS